MLQAMIFLIEKSVAMLKAKIFLIETSLSMSKGFLDHNLFHDPNVTTIHRDYPDNRAKDVRISILWPALPVYHNNQGLLFEYRKNVKNSDPPSSQS